MYDDEYSGQGGSYTVDPKTGKRVRVEEPTIPPAEDAALLDNAVTESVGVKAKKTALQSESSTGV